jgi:hypothetical protein
MTKLISGRVKKIPSANVSASRYEFIRLEETEPDLGVPAANGYVLTANVDGRRAWVLPVANLSAISINALADVDTVTLAPSLGFGLVWNGTNWVPNVITVSSTELSNVANTILGIVQSSLVANTAFFAANANFANTALRSNVATLADSANTAIFATNSTTANTVLSIGNFTTSNLAEGSNLYYTNARVYSNIIAALPTYTGNINAGNIIANAIISGSGGGGSVTGANLISTNNISSVNWIGLYTANVIETAGNLYFTNARVFANVSPLLDRKANVADLTTANVVELNNLYYTNARVLSNVTAYLAANPVTASYGNANVAAFLTTYTGNISAGNIIANTIITGTGSGGSFTGANLISAGNISATTWLNLYTANVIESGDNIFYTNARVFANVSPLLDRKANITDLTTANVTELNNLYYTNSRVRSALSGGTGVSYDNTTGVISIGQNVSTSSNVTFGGLNVTGPVNFYGNVTTHSSNNLSISDNMIYLNNGSPSANPDLGIAFNYNDGVYHHAGFFRDASDGTFKVFDNYDPEPDANIFINTDHASFRLANLSATTLFGNVQGTVSTLSNFTTSNLAEGTNKYFSNALARAALSAGDSTIIYDPTTGTIRATANVTATIETTVNNLSTANVTESAGNLYYTNARVHSNVIALLTTYTGNISAGNINAGTITANTIIGAGTGGSVTGANLISTNNISSVNWLGLYTANVIETSGNLYFTNARVVSALSAGSGIAISANGQISSTTTLNASSVVGLNTANVNEFGGNLYYSNARVLSNVIAFLAANPQGSQFANANVASFLSTYTGNISAGNVIANSFISTAPGTGTLTATGDFNIISGGNIRLTGNVFANTFISTATGAGSLTSTSDFNLVAAGNIFLNTPNVLANGTIVANRITANLWSGIYTANVIESASNLYFTNARVQSNVIGLLPSLAGDNISIAANGRISATVNAANVGGLTTANISEVTNLYYTNARVASNVIALLPTLAGDNISIEANGRISANLLNVSVNSVTGNLNVTGNVIANGFISASASAGLITSSGNITMIAAGAVNINSTNVIATGNVIANNFIATGSGAAILSSTSNIVISASGVVTLSGSSIVVNGPLTANSYSGIVTANVVESASNLYFTNARVVSALSAGSGIAISANGQISSTTTLNANSVTGLNTANVNEFGSNLYYTNARVLSNVTAYLAANPVISTYGNANVGAFLTTYTGNISAGNVIANAIISGTGLGGSITGANLISANNISASVITANTIIGGGSGGSVTGANLISTNNISSVNWIGLYTANVIETSGNLYFTNARVQSNIIGLLPSLAGDNITIAANGRISATASATVNVLTIVGLTTANVTESASNLYYTNARVLSNVTAYLAANPQGGTFGNANVGAFLTTYTGNVNAGNINANAIVAGQGLGGSITGANLISANNISASVIFANTIVGGGTGGSITDANLISTNTITAVNWVGLYTSNVIETSGNLYFTNARVVSALSAGSGISISGNGQISSTTTLNASSVTGLNTANVNEFGGNLYYSNARVVSNVIAYLAANPVISTYGNANVGAFLTTYTGNINAGNVIANNFISTAPGTGTLSATGDFNIVSGGNIRLTGNVFANTFTSTATGTGSISSTSDFNINATSNVSITAGNINLNSNNIATTGNINASKISSTTWQNLYTANVIETAGNLYFTNARVQSNVIALLPTLAGDNITIAANGRISATASATVNVLTIVGLTTANVAESNNNLYYTNARVLSNVLALLPTYTGNINAGNVIANSFVAAATGTGTLTATGDFNIVSGGNIRLTGNVFSNTFISTATGTGSISSTSDFNINATSNVSITAANINLNSSNIVATGNVTATKFFGDGSSLTGVGASSFSGNTNGITEGTNNLYYTNTRVYSNVIALLPTLAGNNITIEANGRISANVSATVFATSIIGLTTANVAEVGSNLYFTNTRVVSALTAGEGITLAANGQISGGVHAITDSQTFAGGNANITLGTAVSLARRIIVTIDGLVQIPTTDYTVSGTILTLIPTPSPNSTIEVKFFGNEAITTQTFNPFLLAGL